MKYLNTEGFEDRMGRKQEYRNTGQNKYKKAGRPSSCLAGMQENRKKSRQTGRKAGIQKREKGRKKGT